MKPLSADVSQRVFRAVLDALARPGTTHRLPAHDAVPAALLPLLALADLSTPVCVLADSVITGDDWPGTVRALTSAPVTALREARLVAALRPVADGELRDIPVGAAAAPDDGALVTLEIKSFRPNDPGCLLTGPGVCGRTELRVAGLPPGFARARRRLTEAFPAGADFLLVAPDGTLAGLPRTTLLEEEEVAA